MPWRIVREKLSSMFGGLEEPEQRWRGCSLGSQEDAAGDRDRREAGAGPGPGRKTSGLAPADRGARRPEPGLPLAASTCGRPAVHPRDLTRSWCRPAGDAVETLKPQNADLSPRSFVPLAESVCEAGRLAVPACWWPVCFAESRVGVTLPRAVRNCGRGQSGRPPAPCVYGRGPDVEGAPGGAREDLDRRAPLTRC